MIRSHWDRWRDRNNIGYGPASARNSIAMQVTSEQLHQLTLGSSLNVMNEENRGGSLSFCTREEISTPLLCRVCSAWVTMLARDPRTATRPSPLWPPSQMTGEGPRRRRCWRLMSPAPPTTSQRQETEIETGDHVTVLWCPSQTWCSKSVAAPIPQAPREGSLVLNMMKIFYECPVWKQNSEQERTFCKVLSRTASNVVDQGKMKKFYVR